MTLSAALGSATSSLRAIQTQLSVASNNIANAADANYSAKTATQGDTVLGGIGSGVAITGIISKVDANLVRSIVEAASAKEGTATTQDYLQRLSDSLGTLSSDGSGDTLSTKLSALESTLDELATTPESTTLKNQAVTDLDDTLASLRTSSDDVQTLRANADSAIGDAVTTVNDALHQIDQLNQDIVRNQAAGKSTADLEDQRNAALQTVAGQLDVSYYTDNTGAMKVYTASGQVLVGSQVHELSFTATGTVNASTTYPSGLSGVSVNGQDITNTLGTGTLAALVTLRDTTLPQVQNQLNSLAVNLKDTLNTISNQGSAAPPPNTLTGTASVSSGDALSASGTLRVAVTDSDGKVVSTQDIDMTTIATVGDLVSTLNGVSGLSASLDGDGHLVLTATPSSNGVAVAGGTIGSGNVSSYFGLNDVMTGNTAADMQVNSALLSDATRFPVGSMDTTATLAVGDQAVSAGSGTLSQSMADALRKAGLTSSAGNLVSGVATSLSSAKTKASSAETTLTTLTGSFSSKYGVNVDEETAHISQLQNSYSASAQVLSAVKAMFDDLLQAVR
jgi:flagellar hook-associated protein 1 FlgK